MNRRERRQRRKKLTDRVSRATYQIATSHFLKKTAATMFNRRHEKVQSALVEAPAPGLLDAVSGNRTLARAG
jgi:hypothetical protein